MQLQTLFLPFFTTFNIKLAALNQVYYLEKVMQAAENF